MACSRLPGDLFMKISGEDLEEGVAIGIPRKRRDPKVVPTSLLKSLCEFSHAQIWAQKFSGADLEEGKTWGRLFQILFRDPRHARRNVISELLHADLEEGGPIAHTPHEPPARAIGGGGPRLRRSCISALVADILMYDQFTSSRRTHRRYATLRPVDRHRARTHHQGVDVRPKRTCSTAPLAQ